MGRKHKKVIGRDIDPEWDEEDEEDYDEEWDEEEYEYYKQQKLNNGSQIKTKSNNSTTKVRSK